MPSLPLQISNENGSPWLRVPVCLRLWGYVCLRARAGRALGIHSCAPPLPHGLSTEAVWAEWTQALLVALAWLLMLSLLVPKGLRQAAHTWFSAKFQVHRLGGFTFLLQCVPTLGRTLAFLPACVAHEQNTNRVLPGGDFL